jgi:multiple sugar transport system permease protein
MSKADITIAPSGVQAALDAPPSPRGGTGRRMQQSFTGWLFALPWTTIFIVFMALPIVASFVLSFTDYGIANLQNPFDVHFIGVQNYVHMLQDQTFVTSALNTVYIVVIGVPLNIAFSLLVAMGINRGVNAVRTIFRLGYYLPVVTSFVAIAVVWRFLLDADLGLVNRLLHLVGLQSPNWLGNPKLALFSVIFVIVWHNIGAGMIIFLAGLQGIDTALYEAAQIDGAGTFALFRHITLPLLRPTLLFVTVLTSIGFLQAFQEPFVMTQGGPLNSTLTVQMYLYQQGFNFFNLGYASAIGYVLFVAIVILALVQFRLLRSET